MKRRHGQFGLEDDSGDIANYKKDDTKQRGLPITITSVDLVFIFTQFTRISILHI